MHHKFVLLYSYFVRLLLLLFPDIPFIMRIRGWAYSLFMIQAGRDFQVAATASLRGLEYLSVGDHVYIGPNSYVLARTGIHIESEVLLAINVVVVDSNHGKDPITNSYRYMRGRSEPIRLSKGCWVGANSVITAGCVIPAGSVVPACTRVVS